MPKALSVSAVLLALALLMPCSSSGAEGALTYRVGLKSIALPAPAGDGLVETGPDYRVLLEPLATTANRLVAGFVLPDEFVALRTGKTVLTRYSLVEVSRRIEFSDVSPQQFKDFGDTMAQQFGAIVTNSLKDQQDEISHKIKALGDNSTTVTLDKPLMLGKFFAKNDAISFGMILPVKVNDQNKKAAAACTLVRVHDRVLFLYTFTPYTGEDSVKWVSTNAEKWADSILSANRE